MNSKSLILCVGALAGFGALIAQDQSASASASGSAPIATENHHGRGHHHEFGYFLTQLNLTDAQEQQVKLFFSDNQPTIRTNRLNLLRAKQAVATVMQKNPADDTTIRSLSADVASFNTELAAQRAKFEAFLQSILTSEQKQTLAALLQQHDARIQAHINLLRQSGSNNNAQIG
jgi:Spy/CpxP family protein refolding chaperone